MALIDPSNWPSFEQDRWAKVRLTWTVICRFKTNLLLKREREENEERIRRANSKKKRKSNRRSTLNQQQGSNPTNSRRKSSTTKNRSLIKKLPENESPDISVHFRALDSPSAARASTNQDLATGTARSRKDSTNIYCINEASTTKRQLFQEEDQESGEKAVWKIDAKKFEEALNEEKKTSLTAENQYDFISKKSNQKRN